LAKETRETEGVNLTLFGYPKTGKTTLFNLLSGAHIEVKAFEDGKREAMQRTCPIPDTRLDRIAALYPDKKKISAAFELVDLAGVSYGEVKNSIYLGALRKADGLIHVVRGFVDPQIAHPRGIIRPQDDISYMEEELMLTDLISITARVDKLEKDLRKAKSPEGEKEKELLTQLRSSLEEGKSIRELSFSPAEEKTVRSFTFLSQKPLLHLVNLDETEIPLIERPEKFYPTRRPGTEVLAFCGKIEAEIAELKGEEQAGFLAEYGLKELSAARFYRELPSLLKTISFFTIGKNEVRAWTVSAGASAAQAAGAIHSDIEHGFIRAEVVTWSRLLELGSWQAAKDKGAIRLEGKDYTVQDGDVVYFRFAA
jgi:GTP-binding protein YchF